MHRDRSRSRDERANGISANTLRWQKCEVHVVGVFQPGEIVHAGDPGMHGQEPTLLKLWPPPGNSLPCSVICPDSHLVNAWPRDAHIYLDEKRHVYCYVDASQDGRGGPAKEFPISVSGVWSQYFEAFDAHGIIDTWFEHWARNPGSKYYDIILNLRTHQFPDHDVKKAIADKWAANGAEASRLGTHLHKQIEEALNARPFDISVPEIRHFRAWVSDVAMIRKWRLYRTEWSIYHDESKVAGQIDAVFLDQDGAYHMVDWKRCKRPLEPDANYEFHRFGKPPFDNYVDNSYSHYIIQQNLYAEILRSDYGLELESMSLVRCHPDAESYQVVNVPYMESGMLHNMLVAATDGQLRCSKSHADR